MIIKNKSQVLVPILLASLAACSSKPKMAAIDPAANPKTEITRLEGQILEGHNKQLDVLAADDFEKAQKYLKEAQEDLASSQSQKEILGDVAQAEAFYQRADQTAEARRTQIQPVMEAREKALTAGARQFPRTEKDLKKTDDDLRSDVRKVEKMSAEEVAELQKRYLNVELEAVLETQIGDSRARIKAADDAKAAKYAPAAFKQAKIDMQSAENKIRANRNESSLYAEDVKKSNVAAQKLTAILAATKGGKVDEGTATRLVLQDQKIAQLDESLQSSQKTSQQLEGQVMEQSRNMAAQNAKLAEAQSAMTLQESIVAAQKSFSPEEAEVFQQEGQLVIRLKKLAFPVGAASLPQNSLNLLAKVRDIATGLNAQHVVVEGHTDSVGAKQKNMELSQERADSVAEYLKSNGLNKAEIESVGKGFEKPVASNKTKEGRAQNRRVDVIVTPAMETRTE